MSCLDNPVLAKTSAKIGTSISTPFVVPSVSRTFGAFAKPAIATSGIRTSQVVGEGFVGRVRLAGRLEVADVLQRRPPLFAGFPGGAHAQAHPDVLGVAAEHEVEEGDVGAVEQDVRGDVRRLEALAEERDVDDAE